MTEITRARHDFCVAEAGAAASLAGLLFVAVSINLGRILEFANLPLRVVESLGDGWNRRKLMRFMANQLPPLPFIIGGVLITLGLNNGFYWIVPGTLLCFASGLFGAWVLLIEIQR